jgi:hypothetical protein
MGCQTGSSGLCCEGFCREGLRLLGFFRWLLSGIRHVFFSFVLSLQSASKAFDASPEIR